MANIVWSSCTLPPYDMTVSEPWRYGNADITTGYAYPTFTAVVTDRGGAPVVWHVELTKQYSWANSPSIVETPDNITFGTPWVGEPGSQSSIIANYGVTVTATVGGVLCVNILHMGVSRNLSNWQNPYGNAGWYYEISDPPEPGGFWTNLRNAQEII